MQEKYLQAVSFEEKSSRKSLPYRIWTFEEVTINGKEIVYSGNRTTRLFFGNKRDSLQIDDLFSGEIKEYKTTSFFIKQDNWYNSIKVVVFSDEDGLEVAAKELRYYKAFPLDEGGNIYKHKAISARQVQDDFDYELQDQIDNYSDEDNYSYNDWSEEQINDIFGGEPDMTWNLD